MNASQSVSKRASGTATIGHSSSQGGLRGHSIGHLYPYSVDPVYTHGWRFVGWTVRNLLSGEDFLPGKHSYDQPGSFKMANGFATSLKNSRTAKQQIENAGKFLRDELEFPVIDKRGFADSF